MAITVGVVGAAATVGSAAMSADASRKSAHQQQDAASAAQAQQLQMQKPWMDAGQFALGQLQTGLMPGGQFSKQFSMADAKNSEAEQHALQQGTQAIQNSAAARGGLLGTNTLQDLTTFAQGNAAQYENQAFNQWLAQRNADLAPLQSLAQIGQTTTTGVADNVSNLTLASGNAGAAGTIGQSNAIGQGISGAGNQISMLAGLFGKGGGSTFSAYDPGGYGMGQSNYVQADGSTGTSYRPSDNYGGG